MEWKKEILNYALAAPGHTVDRYELRQHIYALATAGLVEKRRQKTQLSSACWNLQREGVIACDDSTLRIVDEAKAKARVHTIRLNVGNAKRCTTDGCNRFRWRSQLCYPHANARHKAGEVLLNRFKQPLAVCTGGCGRLAYKTAMCEACEWRATRRNKRTVKPCRDCKIQPAWMNGRCQPCRDVYRTRQQDKVETPKRERYDWVLVHRFVTGQKISGYLSRDEKTEVVRLILRDIERGKADSVWSWGEHINYHGQTLERWVRELTDDALEIGLTAQLRFCFLPDAGEPADSTLEVAA